jgi:hypothetical protein
MSHDHGGGDPVTDANHSRLSHAWLRSPDLSSDEKGLLSYMVTFGMQVLTMDQLSHATFNDEELDKFPAWLETLVEQGWVTAAYDGASWMVTPAAMGVKGGDR